MCLETSDKFFANRVYYYGYLNLLTMKKKSMNLSALKIILVDENMGRSAILRRALQDKGHEVICRLDESENLANSNEITHADVVIVNADIPDEAVFANSIPGPSS